MDLDSCSRVVLGTGPWVWWETREPSRILPGGPHETQLLLTSECLRSNTQSQLSRDGCRPAVPCFPKLWLALVIHFPFCCPRWGAALA